MTTTTPSTADIRAALEDLRTADRILMSVQGTTKFLHRQQLLDGIGLPTGDGYFGGQTVRDNQYASDEMLAAQQAMTDATRRLGFASLEPETLKVWGRLDDIFDGLATDLLAMQQARANQEVAARVRARARVLFARVCEQYPEAVVGVEPLTTDTIDDDDLRPPLDPVKLVVLVALAIAAVVVIVL